MEVALKVGCREWFSVGNTVLCQLTQQNAGSWLSLLFFIPVYCFRMKLRCAVQYFGLKPLQTYSNALKKTHKQTRKNHTVIHSFSNACWKRASAYFQCFQALHGSEVPEMYLVLNEAEIVFYTCGLRNLNLKQIQHCSTIVNLWDLETPPGSIVLTTPLYSTAPIIRREMWKLLP